MFRDFLKAIATIGGGIKSISSWWKRRKRRKEREKRKRLNDRADDFLGS